ncbi:MAG: endonuclease III, partial [Lentisphaerae bacterium]|nr:endonuclease III [Lentisphaerota bacterium]
MKESDIPAINNYLKKEYAQQHAPIVEIIAAQTNDPFKILVTTILSARTKDQTTATVATRLFRTIDKPDDLRKLTQKQLETMIFPVGFYRTKAKHLKQLPAVMDKLFNGQMPDTIESLCQLPGVGRKTANLVMINAFNKHGMCVDVHVHRISNRLGL